MPPDFVYFYDHFKTESSYYDVLNRLLQIFKEQDVKTVLDVGCGTGKLVNLLSKKGYLATGLDNDPSMIEFAKKQYPKQDFFQTNVQSFDFKSDAIIAIDSVLTFLDRKTDVKNAIKNIASHSNRLIYLDFEYTKENPPENGKYSKIDLEEKIYTYESFIEVEDDTFIINGKVIESGKVIWGDSTKRLLLSENWIQKLLEAEGYRTKFVYNNSDDRLLEIIAYRI